jgi:hypothetical protein
MFHASMILISGIDGSLVSVVGAGFLLAGPRALHLRASLNGPLSTGSSNSSFSTGFGACCNREFRSDRKPPLGFLFFWSKSVDLFHLFILCPSCWISLAVLSFADFPRSQNIQAILSFSYLRSRNVPPLWSAFLWRTESKCRAFRGVAPASFVSSIIYRVGLRDFPFGVHSVHERIGHVRTFVPWWILLFRSISNRHGLRLTTACLSWIRTFCEFTTPSILLLFVARNSPVYWLASNFLGQVRNHWIRVIGR